MALCSAAPSPHLLDHRLVLAELLLGAQLLLEVRLPLLLAQRVSASVRPRYAPGLIP